MKLCFIFSNDKYYGNYKDIIYLYHSLDEDINDFINKNKRIFKSMAASIMNSTNDIFLKDDCASFYISLCKKNDLINCFESIEVIEINEDILSKIENLVSNIKVPLIINLSNISYEYVLNNISRIDSVLKRFTKNVLYRINDLDNCDNLILFESSNQIIDYLVNNYERLKIKVIKK